MCIRDRLENDSEDVSLEEEWPSLSFKDIDDEKELREAPKKDIQAIDNLEKKEEPKSDDLDLKTDALQNSSSLLGELRFSDE